MTPAIFDAQLSDSQTIAEDLARVSLFADEANRLDYGDAESD
jgi:hypothetical protein